jgi:acyl-CoA dehydrogenase
MQKAFDGIFANLPVPGLGWFFKSFVRMWSNLNALAGENNDQHVHKIASMILADTEQRVRHTEGVFIPKNTTEQLGKLEHTFKIVKSAEAVERRMRKAIKDKTLPKARGKALAESALAKGVITKEEIALLAQADVLRTEAIQVDSFTQEEYVGHKSKGTTKGTNHTGASASV